MTGIGDPRLSQYHLAGACLVAAKTCNRCEHPMYAHVFSDNGVEGMMLCHGCFLARTLCSGRTLVQVNN